MTSTGAQDQHPSNVPDDKYWRNLVECGYNSQDDPFIAQLGSLSQLNITFLLTELSKIKSDIERQGTTNEKQMESLGTILHRYTKAVQDYDYMNRLQRQPDFVGFQQRLLLQDYFSPFLESQPDPDPKTGNNAARKRPLFNNVYLTLETDPTQKRDLIRETLRKHLPVYLSWTKTEKDHYRSEYSHNEPPKLYSPFLHRLARFIVGVIGGAWLVVPLLIMAFDSSFTKTMVTVSVAVVLFALAISLLFESDNKETLTATATYAAVLVVFVGTSTAGAS